MTTKAKKPEVKKPVAAKAKPVAKKPVAKPVVKKEIKVEEVKAAPQTLAEAAKNKKAVVKVTKEEELSRRLTRARSSLMAGLTAAIKTDVVPEPKADPSTPVKPSYMEKPATKQQPKKSDKVSFDTLNQAEEAKTAPKPAKPSTGKVSFDTLMGDTGQAPVQDIDLAAFYKK